MNILFLTLVEIQPLNGRGIYHDLLYKFLDEGHTVTIVTPVERRKGRNTNYKEYGNLSILQVRTFNLTKTNLIEKGLGHLTLECQFLSAIKKQINHISFDLVLYSTPPITFSKVIQYIKNRDGAYSYLLLKDIFPQNAVDMRMIKERSILHRMFIKKEKKLYRLSDTIGCMSPANVDFILRHNPELDAAKVEVNPNSIAPSKISLTIEERMAIREKYGLPLDMKIFVYGGNLGRPQGLDFLLETILGSKDLNAYFLIVGDGTEFFKVEKWFRQHKPVNAKLYKRLPEDKYARLLGACDVGLIFLDKRFLIPNFPSRLLSYLEMKIPIIAATDMNTDIGDIIEEAKCGYKVFSGDLIKMVDAVQRMIENSNLNEMGDRAWQLLQEKYLVKYSYDSIVNKVK